MGYNRQRELCQVTTTETQHEKPPAPSFELISGNLCLNFINTLDDRFSDHPKELLTAYSDLVLFLEQSGLLTHEDADQLLKQSRLKPSEAEDNLRRAIELREAAFAVFSAIIDKRTVPANSLATLNGYIQEAAAQAHLVPAKGAFEWRFDYRSSLASPRWPIARASAELLASGHLQFVRACSSPTCRWFFLDTSKNHRRRWCDMTKCGNRAKVRKFYARKHSTHQ